MNTQITTTNNKVTKKQPETRLYSDVCSLIENTKHRIATTVNAEICMLHWQMETRSIRAESSKLIQPDGNASGNENNVEK